MHGLLQALLAQLFAGRCDQSAAAWPHSALRFYLVDDRCARHVRFLDLESRARPWNKPVNCRLRLQPNPYVYSAIRRVLIAAPRDGRRRETSGAQLSFAKTPNQCPEVFIVQRCDVIAGNFKHDQSLITWHATRSFCFERLKPLVAVNGG